MRPIWRFFGYDEPNYTYMKGGQKLLSELAALSPEPVYVRVHNLLTSGDGTPALKWGSTGAYSEDAEGRPIYNWTIVDRIVDAHGGQLAIDSRAGEGTTVTVFLPGRPANDPAPPRSRPSKSPSGLPGASGSAREA